MNAFLGFYFMVLCVKGFMILIVTPTQLDFGTAVVGLGSHISTSTNIRTCMYSGPKMRARYDHEGSGISILDQITAREKFLRFE